MIKKQWSWDARERKLSNVSVFSHTQQEDGAKLKIDTFGSLSFLFLLNNNVTL